jgi:hypothetical protein
VVARLANVILGGLLSKMVDARLASRIADDKLAYRANIGEHDAVSGMISG